MARVLRTVSRGCAQIKPSSRCSAATHGTGFGSKNQMVGQSEQNAEAQQQLASVRQHGAIRLAQIAQAAERMKVQTGAT